MSSIFFRTLVGSSSVMGAYGFSRGYRSNDGSPTLTMDRINNGFLNGVLYCTPVFNVVHLSRLLNRLEVDYLGLDPNLYKSQYREVTGECMDTF
jgi:hypothetical protein